MLRSVARASCAAILALGWTTASFAAAEFRINTVTTFSQTIPSVARLNDGTVVVVWESAAEDSSGLNYGVFGQRLKPGGAKIGPEFRVNKPVTFDQTRPHVAGLKNGGFVVVYESMGPSGEHNDIRAQLFSAAGARVGNEIRVNAASAGNETHARVAPLSNGGFVVVWQSDKDNAVELDVYGRRFASDGTPIGAEFRVNSTRTRNQENPAVAGLPGGRFVVVWQSFAQDGDGYGVYFKLYGAGGSLTSERLVNSFVAPGDDHKMGHQYQPRVVALSGGGFVVVWTDDRPSNGVPVVMYGQLYTATGAKNGAPFEINKVEGTGVVDGMKTFPDVAPLSNGGFVVTWQVLGAVKNGTTPIDEDNGIFGRRFSSAGAPIGDDFHINQTVANNQMKPAVAPLPNGRFFVAWESYLQDGAESGIFGRVMQ